MSQVCDFEDQSIDLNAVAAAGLVGIISYASDDTPKNLTQANFNQALSLDLTVNLVCEQGTQPALRGAAGGTHDATISNQQASALGYSTAATVFYVAEDPSQLPTSDFSIVEAYFQAVNAIEGCPVGGYGGYELLVYLYGLGLITKGWMVQTWNQGAPSPLPPWIVLMQVVGGTTYGLPIDVDDVLQADYGQYPRPAPPPPPPQPPQEGDVMALTPVIQFKTTQFDFFQMSPYGGGLYHKWSIDGGNNWASEQVAPGPFQGTPQVRFVLGQFCDVFIEEGTGMALVQKFRQTATGAGDGAWAPSTLP